MRNLDPGRGDGPTYSTWDLPLATYLVMSRNLIGIEANGNQIGFVFERDAKIESDIDDFRSHRGAVAPARYLLMMTVLEEFADKVRKSARSLRGTKGTNRGGPRSGHPGGPG